MIQRFNVGDQVRTKLSGRSTRHVIAARMPLPLGELYQVLPAIPGQHPGDWFDSSYFERARGHVAVVKVAA
jgi:hypothetical protein